jgi:hypothetical protein
MLNRLLPNHPPSSFFLLIFKHYSDAFFSKISIRLLIFLSWYRKEKRIIQAHIKLIAPKIDPIT